MINVSDLLKKKGKAVYSLSPEVKTLEALKIMTEKKVGALVILDNGKLAGIISERDFVHQIAKTGASDLSLPVQSFMTTHLFVVTPKQTIGECMILMTDHRVRHLPVMDGEQLIGVISIGDVVKELIADRDSMIENLENYMSGRTIGY